MYTYNLARCLGGPPNRVFTPHLTYYKLSLCCILFGLWVEALARVQLIVNLDFLVKHTTLIVKHVQAGISLKARQIDWLWG